jgi:hypothetical protein
MAFYIYARQQTGGNRTTYTHVRDAHLFGRDASDILRLLRLCGVPKGQGEPYRWNLRVRDAFAKEGHADWSFIIHLRPSSGQNEFFELLEVFGDSDSGWTPALLRLRQVLDVSAQGASPPTEFPVDENAYPEPIYTVTHFRGTIVSGDLIGSWNVPGVSPTNSTFMWPDTLDYFRRCMPALPGRK